MVLYIPGKINVEVIVPQAIVCFNLTIREQKYNIAATPHAFRTVPENS